MPLQTRNYAPINPHPEAKYIVVLNSGSPYLSLYLRSQDEMIHTIRINLPGMYRYSTSDVVCIRDTTDPFQYTFITVIFIARRQSAIHKRINPIQLQTVQPQHVPPA